MREHLTIQTTLVIPHVSPSFLDLLLACFTTMLSGGGVKKEGLLEKGRKTQDIQDDPPTPQINHLPSVFWNPRSLPEEAQDNQQGL